MSDGLLIDPDEIWVNFYSQRVKKVSNPYWAGEDHVKEDVITVFGLRRKHIERKAVFGPPDLETWMRLSPDNAIYWVWEDSKNTWHLVIVWKEIT